jgi:hydroxybutyrate-dimer hydrolase
VLNEKYGSLAKDNQRHVVVLTPKNTVTIASSISNGAGSALLARSRIPRA